MNLKNLAGKLNNAVTLVTSMLQLSNKEEIQKSNVIVLIELLSNLTTDPLDLLSHLRNSNFKIKGVNGCFETNTSGQELWCVELEIPELLLIKLDYKSSFYGGWEIDESDIAVKVLNGAEDAESIQSMYQDALQAYAIEFACLVQGNELCDTPTGTYAEPNDIDLADVHLLSEWAGAPNDETKHLVQTFVTSGEDSAVETTLVVGARDEEDAANQAILALDRSCKLVWSDEEDCVTTPWGYPRYGTQSIRKIGGLESVVLEQHFHAQRCHKELHANTSHIPKLTLHVCLKDSEFEGELSFTSVMLSNPVLGDYLLGIAETLVDIDVDAAFNHFSSTFEDDLEEVERIHEEFNVSHKSQVDPSIDLIALLNHSKTEVSVNVAGNFDSEATSQPRKVILVNKQTDAEYPATLRPNL